MNIKKKIKDILFDRGFLRIPRSFIRHFGPAEAIYLCILIEWEEHLEKRKKIEGDEDNEFFIPQSLIESKISFTKSEQQTCRANLINQGVISTKRQGIPFRNYYTINYKHIYQLLIDISTPNLDQFLIEEIDLVEEVEWTKDKPLVDEKSSTNYNKELKEERTKRSPYKSSSKEEDLTANVPVLQKTKLGRLLLRRNKMPIEFTPTPPSVPNYRGDVKKVIDYWNSSPGLWKHIVPRHPAEPPTKALLRVIKIVREVLTGTFLQSWPPYSVDDVIRAVDGYKLRLFNPDYSPVNKAILRKINLTNFFWNAYSSHTSSMFLECLNNPPKLIKNMVPRERELNPQMTQWLQDFYKSKVLLGTEREFNQIEQNKFIRGANLLFQSLKSLRQRANMLTGPHEFCEYTIDALMHQFGTDRVSPGNVASEWTYRDLLPKYLQTIGRID